MNGESGDERDDKTAPLLPFFAILVLSTDILT